jgi:ADP-ribose pyrophosphatase YjhB (NUDIX family)
MVNIYLQKIKSMSNIVGCLIVNKETNKLLMLRRSLEYPTDPYKGYWSFLTGHIEKGELPYQAIDRETEEEIGIKKNSLKFNKFTTIKKNKNKNVYFYYTLVSKEFKPNLNEENMDYMWCNFYELPKPLYPGSEKIIETLLTFI